MSAKILNFPKNKSQTHNVTPDMIKSINEIAVPPKIDFASTIIAIGHISPEHVKRIILHGFGVLLQIRDLAQSKGDSITLSLLDAIGIYTEYSTHGDQK